MRNSKEKLCRLRLLLLTVGMMFAIWVTGAVTTAEVIGELKKWHKVTLTFDGPETSEGAELNPFMNYRLNVLFSHPASGKSYRVPGYFAADGNAAETSATSGNKWRVHFAPSETGEWNYKVDFRTGKWLAVSDRDSAGVSAGYMDGAEGRFHISATDKAGRDNRAKGCLQYDGTRYLKFAETGEIFLKAGPDAPENLLSYADFDGTFHNDGHYDHHVKTWAPHQKDWKEGDPSWKGGKGRALIGGINYLASKGLNSISFLTMNIEGDDRNVFPYVDYTSYGRFDCSKLDQWEVVFQHAGQLGMFLHFKLMESENQGLLDNGAVGALTQLYYREMIARFGHHLSLNWNIGEEFGDWEKSHHTPPYTTAQRLAAAAYFHKHDPYQHHIVIHNGESFEGLLGTNSQYTGVSVQTWMRDFSRVHDQALRWINASKMAGKQWAVAVDEPGDHEYALVPDAVDPEKNNARINGLWGAFMAGAWGTEWYFGYKHEHSDLSCQDWRSRDLFWDQCSSLLDFFNKHAIPLGKTDNHNQLVQEGDYCLAKPGELYIVFLRNGQGTIDLSDHSGAYSVKWFDPRNGGELQDGAKRSLKAGSIQQLSNAPSEPERDWVVLLRKI